MYSYIETDRLRITYLEEYVVDDMFDVIDILGDGETAWWFGIRPLGELDEAKDYIRYCGGETMGVYEKASGKIAGVLQKQFLYDSDGTVQLGYALSPESRGKGYMTEAVKAECAKLFEFPSVTRIRLMIHPENEKSIGVATRCGFKQVGPVTDGEEPGAAKGDPDDEYILLRDEHK